MYQALYRKYRPQTFDDVAGQEHITQTLKNQIASNRASHAYLFVGTRGTGKTTCAKILARAVNCVNPESGNPCNECEICRSIESGQATDVLEIDAASNNGVDNVRALRDEAVFSPASAKMRVYIIDEVHMLSGAAFNALLKILEEPPGHLLFILATTELHKVPATVVSRCQRFSFRRPAREIIAERLAVVAGCEGMDLSSDAAALLSRLSDGSFRDAISLLDQCSGVSTIDLTRVRDVLGLPAQGESYRLLTALANRDAAQAFALLDELYMAGKQASSLFGELSELTRDALVAALIPDAGNLLSGALSHAELRAISKSLPPARLTHILTALNKASGEFTRGSGDRLIAEINLASMCDERLDTWPEALAARLEALERGAAQYVPYSATESETPEAVFAFEPQSEVTDDLPPWDASGPEKPPEAMCEAQREEPEAMCEAQQAAPENVQKADAVATVSEQSNTGIWPEILAALPASISAVISNTSAALEGGVLKITARDPFTHSFVSSDITVRAIREAAEKIAGHDVCVVAEMSEKSDAAQMKLDDLSQRFGDLMKFE